jgi:hypothetical protein
VLAGLLWKLSELDHKRDLIESPDCPDLRHFEKHHSHGSEQKIRQPLKKIKSIACSRINFEEKPHRMTNPKT